jgi:hypothetical protein
MNKNLTFLGCAGLILLWLVIVGLCSLLGAAIIYYVWNLAISDIFVIKQITFLQSWLIGLGLSIVGSLFKSSLNVKK